MENIKELAISCEKRNVRLSINPDELEEMREKFIRKSVDLKQMADEKANILANFKLRMAPLQSDTKKLLQDIQNGFQDVDTEVYLLDDQDTGFMRYYTEDGEEVFSRPLRPDEKQLNILNANRIRKENE
jgi:hypothetical protein